MKRRRLKPEVRQFLNELESAVIGALMGALPFLVLFYEWFIRI